MTFGLVGTGPWAHMAHGPGLVQAEGVELVGVWGRRPEEAGRLAAALDTTAYDDDTVLLGNVDAVAFAVRPGIQAETAREAASAGKHHPVTVRHARSGLLRRGRVGPGRIGHHAIRPDNSQVDGIGVAARELAAAARSGQPDEVDVAFGARVVELLADAQAQVDSQRTAGTAP